MGRQRPTNPLSSCLNEVLLKNKLHRKVCGCIPVIDYLTLSFADLIEFHYLFYLFDGTRIHEMIAKVWHLSNLIVYFYCCSTSCLNKICSLERSSFFNPTVKTIHIHNFCFRIIYLRFFPSQKVCCESLF